MDNRRVSIDAYLMTSKRLMPPRGPWNTPSWVFGCRTRFGPLQLRRRANGIRRVLEAAERFMAKWHDNEATLSWNRHASATGGAHRNRKGGVTVAGIPQLTKSGRRWQTG